MNQYDEICEMAIGNYGLVTTAGAEGMGVARKDLGEWVKLGRLERLGWGVYRIVHYAPSEYDRYAVAVALVGEGAMLWGESVLAMHNLALVNPLFVTVATAKRVRKQLPAWLKVVRIPPNERADVVNGIPCQNLAAVFRGMKGKLMTERLATAIREAARRGLLRHRDARQLKKEFRT